MSDVRYDALMDELSDILPTLTPWQQQWVDRLLAEEDYTGLHYYLRGLAALSR